LQSHQPSGTKKRNGVALVADIGGTNARFAIADRTVGEISLREIRRFRAADFQSVDDAAKAYLQSVGVKPSRACFAAAGPIIDDAVDFTNSHWTLRADDIAESLGLKTVRIVNDFFALAAGVEYLPPSSFIEVKSGAPIVGAPRLVIGPGTGFGQALIVPTICGDRIIATEGGHASFAPGADIEWEIRRHITREHSRVSIERVLSGSGLRNIYHALCAIEGEQDVFQQAEAITAAAIAGEDQTAAKTVNMFCDILGQVAGDAALSAGARGGVVLGGGILPKIKDIFIRSAFVARFVDKGRMSEYLSAIPVKLITGEGAALYGAAASLEDN